MTYDPFVWHDGATGGTLIDASHLNRIEQGIQAAAATADTAAAAGPSIIAPAPSGGDDTAVLQPLLDQASNNGTLILRHGSYRANLATTRLFQQPLIVGQGRYMTTIEPADATKPAVQFNGTSGSLAGGGLRSLRLQKTTNRGVGVALEYNGAGGVQSSDVQISGFDRAVRWHNELAGSFTEFSTFEGSVDGCNIIGEYKVTAGDPSFNGSGFVGNGTLNLTSTATTAILIGPHALPYNAPISALFSGTNSGQSIITNNNTDRTAASFQGTLRCEGINVAAATAGRPVWLAGTFTCLVSPGRTVLGNLYLVDKIYLGGGQIADMAQYRPFQRNVTLAAGTTALTVESPGSALIHVEITATGYHYASLLHCWQSPYNTGGSVTVLSTPEALNTSAWGAPTFGWANRNLTVTNSNYTAATTARLTVTPLTSGTADTLGQN